MDQFGFYACYKTKLIFTRYKQFFAEELQKTELVFIVATYKNQVNF